MNFESDRQTLVTCLYDLEKREKSGRRPIDFYFRHGRMVLELEHPLVVFVDPELSDRVIDCRRALGLANLTRVICEPLEQWPMFACVPQWVQAKPFSNANSLKDSPWHQLIAWSKLDMLEQAVEINPFKSGHFAWIDFGLGHVAASPRRFPEPSERVSLLQICATSPGEIENPRQFLSAERHRIGAGFFRGSIPYFRLFTRHYRAVLAGLLDHPTRTTEQMIFALLSANHPELVEHYYGDYHTILENWDGIRGDLPVVMANLAHCRLHGLWDRAIDISERTIHSWEQGHFEPDDDQLAQLLDESFIAAWYSNQHGLASKWAALIMEHVTHSGYFNSHRDRIMQNLKYSGPY